MRVSIIGTVRTLALIAVVSSAQRMTDCCSAANHDLISTAVEVGPEFLTQPPKKGDIPLFASIYREVSDQEITFLATHYECIFVIDAYCNKELVDKLRQKNPRLKVFVLTNPYFFQSHYGTLRDEWKARTEDGHYIYSTYGRTAGYKIHLMDYPNRNWLTFFAEQAARTVKSSGADGLLCDTLTNSPPYPAWASGLHRGYCLERWKAANNFLLKELRGKLGQAEIIYNGLVPDERVELQNCEYLADSDGAALETFGLGGPTLDDGLEYRIWFFRNGILTLMKHAVSQGKYLFLAIRTDDSSRETQRFALCAFLLLRTDRTFFYAASKKGDETIMWFPEWQLELGEPVGPYQQDRELYTREYENGLIVVNGDMSARTVHLKVPHVAIDTKRVTSVELQSYTGAIFLKLHDTVDQ